MSVLKNCDTYELSSNQVKIWSCTSEIVSLKSSMAKNEPCLKCFVFPSICTGLTECLIIVNYGS